MIIQVTLADEMVKEVDKIAKSIGMSRSSYCAYLIGQGANAWNKSMELSNEVVAKLLNDLANKSVENKTV